MQGWKKIMDEHEGVIKRPTPKSLSICYTGSGPSVGTAGQYDEIILSFCRETGCFGQKQAKCF